MLIFNEINDYSNISLFVHVLSVNGLRAVLEWVEVATAFAIPVTILPPMPHP